MIVSGALSTPKPLDQRAELGKAAKQFEAIFVRQMLTAARKANLGEGLLDSGAVEQFRSMQDSQFADIMSEHGGGLGLAASIERQLSQHIGKDKP